MIRNLQHKYCLLYTSIDGQKYFCAGLAGETVRDDSLNIFKNTKDWLERYFSGQRPAVSELMLEPPGGQFRQSVWNILCRIPYGHVMTYGDIAREIAEKTGRSSMSGQAVGGAVSHNPISIIIPCHRVVAVSYTHLHNSEVFLQKPGIYLKTLR